MNGLTCPMYHRNADHLAEILVLLRRIRRGLRVCRSCLDRQTCMVRTDLNETVAQAAREVLVEMEG